MEGGPPLRVKVNVCIAIDGGPFTALYFGICIVELSTLNLH